MAHDRVMDTQTHGSKIEVIRVLVLVQGAVAVASAFQVLLFGAFLGAPLGVVMVLGVGAAALTLVLAARVTTRSRRARRFPVVTQVLWLGLALVDLLLAIFLASRGLGLVPTLTRVVLPIAILRLLHDPGVLAEFRVIPRSRRKRRPPPAPPSAVMQVDFEPV